MLMTTTLRSFFLDDLGVAVAFVLAAERDLLEPIAADSVADVGLVDVFFELLEACPRRALVGGDLVVCLFDPREGDGDALAASPLEDRPWAFALDLEGFADVLLVEIHRELPLEPSFK